MNPESLAAPETPGRIEDAIVRIPGGDTVPQALPEAAVPLPAARPWYRRRRPVLAVIAAIAALLGGLAAGLVLTVFAPSGYPSPASVLKADGYTWVLTANPAQITAMGGPSTASIKPFVTSMVMGSKGSKAEIVFGLTDTGRIEAKANLGDFGGSILQLNGTWYMKSGNLVDDTTASSLGLSGS